MKIRILAVEASLLLGLTACAQVDVPSTVKTAFNKKFPDARAVKWEMENANEYEANFKMNGTEMSANFDKNAQWTETETEIKKKELPDAVLKTVERSFDGYQTEEVARVENPQGSFYEVDVEKDHQTWEVQISSDGKILNKKKESEEDEED